jgi:hypothetical protein
MVEILCPHCEEEIGLDDDADGEFSCSLCDEEFIWDGLLDDGDSAGFYDWKSFWIGLGIPNLFVIMAFCAGVFFDWIRQGGERSYSDDAVGSLFVVSFLSWITLFIYGISVKNKAMWQGTLAGIVLAPFVFILGALWYIVTTDWSVF